MIFLKVPVPVFGGGQRTLSPAQVQPPRTHPFPHRGRYIAAVGGRRTSSFWAGENGRLREAATALRLTSTAVAYTSAPSVRSPKVYPPPQFAMAAQNTSSAAQAPACLIYNTTYHPCVYPFLTLPNTTTYSHSTASSSTCSSTFADAEKDAHDAARALFFALGTPVLGRYIYLLRYNCRRSKFGTSSKLAVCGFLCMIAWMIRALDVAGARGVLPYWLDAQLAVFSQNALITALILFVRSWRSTPSFTQGQQTPKKGGRVTLFLFVVTMVLLWGVHFLLLTPLQFWMLGEEVTALGGVSNGTLFGISQLVASAIVLSYCSMALHAGLKITRGLEGLGANKTGATRAMYKDMQAKAKRTILSYIVGAFICSLIAFVYHVATAVSSIGKILVETPPCAASDAYMQFSHLLLWVCALIVSPIIRSNRRPAAASQEQEQDQEAPAERRNGTGPMKGPRVQTTVETAPGTGQRELPTTVSTDDMWQVVNPMARRSISTNDTFARQNSIKPLHDVYSIEMHGRAGSVDFGGGSAGPPVESVDATPHVAGSTEHVEEKGGSIGRRSSSLLRSASFVHSFLSASAESLNPAKQARRARAWCKVEGPLGGSTIVVLGLLIVNLLVIMVLHCTSILDKLQGRSGIRGMLLIPSTVIVPVGAMCSILLARVVWALVSVTCRHTATHTDVARRLREQKHSEWKVCRAWNLYELYTSPGGRFFDVFEFSRELLESCLQILAVREYANNGVDRVFLDFYVAIVGLNSLSAVTIVLPKCAPKRWRRMSPESRATRERAVLTLDMICDALCTFEILTVVCG